MAETTLKDVEMLAEQLSLDDQLLLMEHLAGRILQKTGPKKHRDLFGIWKEYFPEDMDIDTTLREIRSAWKEDFVEFKR